MVHKMTCTTVAVDWKTAYAYHMTQEMLSQIDTKSKLLEIINFLSAFHAGFGTLFLAQSPIPVDGSSPEWILILFGLVTSLVV